MSRVTHQFWPHHCENRRYKITWCSRGLNWAALQFSCYGVRVLQWFRCSLQHPALSVVVRTCMAFALNYPSTFRPKGLKSTRLFPVFAVIIEAKTIVEVSNSYQLGCDTKVRHSSCAARARRENRRMHSVAQRWTNSSERPGHCLSDSRLGISRQGDLRGTSAY